MQQLPEFGSGIGFCPTGKRSRGKQAAPDGLAVANAAPALQQRFAEEEEEQQVWAGRAVPCIFMYNVQCAWHPTACSIVTCWSALCRTACKARNQARQMELRL